MSQEQQPCVRRVVHVEKDVLQRDNLESEAESLLLQEFQRKCAAEKEQKESLIRETAVLHQKIQEHEEVSLELMDSYEQNMKLQKRVHEAAVQNVGKELKTTSEKYDAVRAEMEATRHKYETIREGKYLPELDQLRASAMEGKILIDKELIPSLKNELDRTLDLRQQIHDLETHSLDLRLQVSVEKCETVMVQKEVVCREKAALLRQVIKLRQGEEELRDEVDTLQVLLKVKTRENQALQSEIKSLKHKKKLACTINVEQLEENQEDPSPHGWISWLTDQVCTPVNITLLTACAVTIGGVAFKGH
ncbi:Laminin subunit beta-4 [Dissostichus eleginoides]|uniref:Laminin subunit beta-4 n=1 Tax=Dissostichus eleginoides TaxID=100907 RepID=A0AAD9BTN2_DISEL|nr:Laminin subunit beta-4 [Dissostichus eleginoides]